MFISDTLLALKNNNNTFYVFLQPHSILLLL